MSRPLRIVVAAAALALCVGILVPAAASAGPSGPAAAPASTAEVSDAAYTASTSSTPAPATTTTPDSHAAAVCGIVKAMDSRLKKFESRASAAATVRGSIAWLNAQSDKQRQTGHQVAADRLAKRAAARARHLATVKNREPRLASALAADCSEA